MEDPTDTFPSALVSEVNDREDVTSETTRKTVVQPRDTGPQTRKRGQERQPNDLDISSA